MPLSLAPQHRAGRWQIGSAPAPPPGPAGNHPRRPALSFRNPLYRRLAMKGIAAWLIGIPIPIIIILYLVDVF